MKVREDKASRTMSIELTSGDFVTLVAKGKDARVVDYIAQRFADWVSEVLDDAVDEKTTRLAKEDEGRQ